MNTPQDPQPQDLPSQTPQALATTQLPEQPITTSSVSERILLPDEMPVSPPLKPAPVTTPVPSKKPWLLAGLALGLMLLAAAGYVLRGNLSPNATDTFYQAVTNHMRTKYIRQRYTIDTGYSVTTSDAQIDLSDPASPKTMQFSSYEVDGKKTMQIATVTTGNYAEYAKIGFSDLSGGTDAARNFYKPLTNVWVRLTSAQEAAWFDPFSMSANVNQTQGELLVGNYPPKLRDELSKMYRESGVFEFDKTKVVSDTVDGKNIWKYPVKVNETKLAAINKKAEEKLGLKHSYNEAAAVPSFTCWIDKKTQRVVKVIATTQEQEITIDLTYPTTLTVQPPKDAKTLKQLGLSPPVTP
jgi:hypothetical protein